MEAILAIVHSPDFQAKLAAAILTAIAGGVLRYLLPTERVIWGTSHAFAFGVPQQGGGKAVLYTRSFSIKNEGREPATDVEVHFSSRPEHIQIWPTFNYETETNPEGHFCLRLANLGKKEWMSIEVVSWNKELPLLLRVRTRQGAAREVPIAPMKVAPRWLLAVIWALIVAGVFWIIETLLLLLRVVAGA